MRDSMGDRPLAARKDFAETARPKPEPVRPDRYRYVPVYDYSKLPGHLQSQERVRKLVRMNCDPEYIVWRERDRSLWLEANKVFEGMDPDKRHRIESELASAQRLMKREV